MLLSIVSIIVNAIYHIVLNMDLYTDRAALPDGTIGEWHRSPVSSLAVADQSYLLHLQIFFAVICVGTSLLIMFGVKNHIIRIIQRISLITSTVMFITIMSVAANIHPKYA